MEVTVAFDGEKRLSCRVGRHVVQTDQSVADGGKDGAPSPSNYLMVSLASCGAYYVLSFCELRDIPLESVAFSLDAHFNEETKLYDRIEYKLRVTDEFPKKYHTALARSVEQCFVKKHFANPPEFSVSVE